MPSDNLYHRAKEKEGVDYPLHIGQVGVELMGNKGNGNIDCGGIYAQHHYYQAHRNQNGPFMRSFHNNRILSTRELFCKTSEFGIGQNKKIFRFHDDRLCGQPAVKGSLFLLADTLIIIIVDIE